MLSLSCVFLRFKMIKIEVIMKYVRNLTKTFLNNEENLFCIGFILFFFSYWVSQAWTSYPKYPMLVVAFCFFVLKNLKTRYTKKEILVASVIIFVGVCTWISTGSMSAFWCAIIVASMKNVSIKKVLKIMLFVSMAITVIVMLLSLCGIYGEVYKVYFGRVETSEIRFHLGAKHPNSLHFRYLFAVSLIFALLYERMKSYHYVILFALNAGLAVLTLSRTGFICTSLVIGAMALCRYLPKIFATKYTYAIVNIACACFIVGSLVGVIGYDTNSGLWSLFNKIASGRLELGNQCFAMYGLTFFGTKVDELIVFDMGIPRVLIENGVLVFIMVYAGMFAVMYYFFKKKNYKYIILIAVFLLYSMFEKMNMYAYYNIQIIIMGFAMWQSLTESRKKAELN